MAEHHADIGKNKRREDLIRVVQALIKERPFDDITIDDIIKAADLSRSAFYYHFAGGKEELRAELVQRGILSDTPVQDTRKMILDAAVQIFARNGMAATNLEDIAAEAGVTRGALNWHFHSKDELLLAIVERFGPQAVMRTSIEQILQESRDDELLDDETILQRVVGAFYDAYMATAEGDLARLAILQCYTHPQAAQVLADKIITKRRLLLAYVKQRQAEGRFCRHVDAGLFVHVIVSFFILRAIGRGFSNLLLDTQLSREEIINQVVFLVLHGMVAKDQAQERNTTGSSHLS